MEIIIPYLNIISAVLILIAALIILCVTILNNKKLFNNAKEIASAWPAYLAILFYIIACINIFSTGNMLISTCLMLIAVTLYTGYFFMENVGITKMLIVSIAFQWSVAAVMIPMHLIGRLVDVQSRMVDVQSDIIDTQKDIIKKIGG